MLVIGAGGHALEILDVLLQDNYPHPIYFYDDITPSLTSFRGFPVVKSEAMLKEIYPASFFFVLGIGNPIHRKNMYEKFISLGGDFSSVISNKSVHSHQLLNKEFDLMIFPSQRHGFTGYTASYFLKLRWKLFWDCLSKQ
jgi:hypothetical protein